MIKTFEFEEHFLTMQGTILQEKPDSIREPLLASPSFLNEIRELPAINYIINELANKRTFVDVGAHLGFYAIPLAYHFNNVVAYEPWLRPAELATDTANSVDVALHALDLYEAEKGTVDGILLLQPTSPFRTPATIQRGISLFSKHGYQSVLGVSPTHAHPMWALKMEGDYLVPFMKEHGLEVRSQDLPPAYAVNGSFYLIAPSELRECRSFVGSKTIPLLIESPQEAIDIDSEWDFKIAEIILTSLYES
jgi:CMP-N,N'-diacetyllegionaminic acid synthase